MIAALLLSLAVLVMPAVDPAPPQVTLSTDQITWTTTLNVHLLSNVAVWVPGDSQTASFWVRNESDTLAEVFINVDLATDQADQFDVTVALDGDHLTSDNDGDTDEPGTVFLDAMRVSKVLVTVTYMPDANNATQGVTVPVSFRVTLTQVGDETDDDTAADEAPSATHGVPEPTVATEPKPLVERAWDAITQSGTSAATAITALAVAASGITVLVWRRDRDQR